MTPFHAGEIEVQARLHRRDDARRVGRIVGSEIPSAIRRLLGHQRLAVAATLDEALRPWASLLTGPPGFIQTPEASLLRLATTPTVGDPLLANLRERPELGLLVIDLRTRQRLRLNGRGLVSDDGIFLLVDQAYGNCPKYIQKRRILDASVHGPAGGPGPPHRSTVLDEDQQRWIAASDTFFIATWCAEGGVDASHRGGRPGFVQVLDERTLEFPDYPGNNMFNTLGNLARNPRAGLLFARFDTGDLLQLTGRAHLLWEPRTAVRVEIEDVRQTDRGSALRFELIEPWPENP
jgi:uncharacterized protein